MLRHFTPLSSSVRAMAPLRLRPTLRLHPTLRFGALAALAIQLSACSSKDERLFDDARGVTSSAGASAGGSGSLSPGTGGFTFVDDQPEDVPDLGGSAGATGDAGVPDPYVLPPSVTIGDSGTVLCGSTPCACTNGVDDDGDGKSDGFDEECTGALDNDEGTFSTGIPGDNSDPKWQDCFFDGNSGAGDDHCRYHADCLTGDKPATDPDCAVSAECLAFCAPRTPNGCDCFGCCTVQLEDASSVSVFIGESCSLENVDDAASCPRCTPSTACGNTCGECELCPGKSVEDLPASCSETPAPDGSGGSGSGGSGGGSETPPAYSCDAGQTVCSSTADCPSGDYCSLGCCLAFVIY